MIIGGGGRSTDRMRYGERTASVSQRSGDGDVVLSWREREVVAAFIFVVVG